MGAHPRPPGKARRCTPFPHWSLGCHTRGRNSCHKPTPVHRPERAVGNGGGRERGQERQTHQEKQKAKGVRAREGEKRSKGGRETEKTKQVKKTHREETGREDWRQMYRKAQEIPTKGTSLWASQTKQYILRLPTSVRPISSPPLWSPLDLKFPPYSHG